MVEASKTIFFVVSTMVFGGEKIFSKAKTIFSETKTIFSMTKTMVSTTKTMVSTTKTIFSEAEPIFSVEPESVMIPAQYLELVSFKVMEIQGALRIVGDLVSG